MLARLTGGVLQFEMSPDPKGGPNVQRRQRTLTVTTWLGAAAVTTGLSVAGAVAAHADAGDATGSGLQTRSAAPSAGPKTPKASRSASTRLRTPAAASVRRATAAASSVPPAGQAVSPLGTPEQIAVEKNTGRVERTLPVAVMKTVLRASWRSDARKLYSAVGGPDQANTAALGNAVDEWAMASAFQVQILNSNQPTIVTQVAPPHQWYGVGVNGSRILLDNPDTIYRFTGVNYASQYVITGRLPETDPQTSFSVLTGLKGTTAAILDGSQLELGPDRTFVITVSSDPTLPGEKNHIQLTPDTTLIAIRDTLSDWTVQDPMALSIHRTAGPPPSLFGQFGGFAIPVIGPTVAKSPVLTALVSVIPPLPSTPPFVQGLLAAALMLRGLSEEAAYIRVATTDATTGQPKAPNVFTDPTRNASFLATQLQSAGYFQLGNDDALVLTVRPNNAGYFSVPVTNDWTITGDYATQQTSLNNNQARANPDGSYTIVVSPTEPQLADGTSVWNWVSTGGLNQGTMAIRFQRIDAGDPNTPKVSSQVVKIADLASALPAGTPVVTPAERDTQLATRTAGYDRRFAPYPQTATAGALASATAAAAARAPGPVMTAILGAQAFIYGYPLAEYERVRATAPTLNTIMNLTSFANPDVEPIWQAIGGGKRPNVDTFYSVAELDLTNGPVVLSIPDMGSRYYSFQLTDPYTNVSGYIGSRTTGPGPGTYAITWAGGPQVDVPGAQTVVVPYASMLMLGRTLAGNIADQQSAIALMKQYALTPTGATGPNDAIVPASSSSIDVLDAMSAAMAQNPPPSQDDPELAKLARIGVGPGLQVADAHLGLLSRMSLAVSVKATAALLPAVAQLTQSMSARQHHGWAIPSPDIGDYGTDYLLRAGVAEVGLVANTPEEAMYEGGLLTAKLLPLKGAKSYTLHFAPGQAPPADAFWSVTVYDAAGQLVQNSEKRYSVSSSRPEELVYRPDGSIDIVLSRRDPQDPGVNWLPTPRGGFSAYLRIYVPEQSALDLSWLPPGIKILSRCSTTV